jgi:hypothetical protein
LRVILFQSAHSSFRSSFVRTTAPGPRCMASAPGASQPRHRFPVSAPKVRLAPSEVSLFSCPEDTTRWTMGQYYPMLGRPGPGRRHAPHRILRSGELTPTSVRMVSVGYSER